MTAAQSQALYNQASSWLNMNNQGTVTDYRAASADSSAPYGSGAGSIRGTGQSASSVAAGGATVDPMVSAISGVMDQIYGLTERNTARSEAQAGELRSWQEQQNKLAMDFNSAEAAKNREWQQMMSNTAHQREVADLRAAGLNPILSASGGNGAAVTSGATASGVTSSGAMPEVDKSADSSLVQLLGSMWAAQTTIEAQRINAQNNLAIADKNNATSELVARLYTEQSREASQLAASVGLQQSEISAAVSRLVAEISKSGTISSASIYSEANKVVAGLNVEASKYNTLVNGIVDLAQTGLQVQNALDVAGIQSTSAKDVASISNDRSLYGLLSNLFKEGTGSSAGSWLSKILQSKGNGDFSKLFSGLSSGSKYYGSNNAR